MVEPSRAQKFLDNLYSYYLARKGRPLTVKTIEDKTIVSEYKPVSARTLQRKGSDYSSFVVSPFEPVNIKRAKSKEKNPLILESSVDKKPKLDFSLIEWVNQLRANEIVSYSSSDFRKADGEVIDIYDENLVDWKYVIIDHDLDYIADSLDLAIGLFRGTTEDTNNDGDVSIREIFNEHKDEVDPNALGEGASRLFDELLIVSQESGNPDFENENDLEFLFNDSFLVSRGLTSIRELEDMVFSFKEILKLNFDIPKSEDGVEIFDNYFFKDTSGYHKEVSLLNQYSLNLRSIFLLKNKDFFDSPKTSNISLILSAEENKSFKEKILNLKLENLFTVKRFLILDDRNAENKKEVRTKNLNFTFTPRENLGTLGFPIVNPTVLSEIDLKNNYELVNNYLTENTFKLNPLNLMNFESSNYQTIGFTQEELLNAKYKNSQGEIIQDGPGIFIDNREETNSFKSILKKYLIYEIDNLTNYLIEAHEGTNFHPETSATYYVLINLLWEKIEPLIEKGIVLKTNYSLDIYSYQRLKRVNLDLMLKYLNQVMYIIKKPGTEKYYANFYGSDINEYDKNVVKNYFFKIIWNRIIETIDYTIQSSGETSGFDLQPNGNDPEAFEDYLNNGEIKLSIETFYSVDDFLPDLSIIYSEDDMTNIESSTVSGLHERTKWSTVVDFARDENLKSNSVKAECVIKLKDFLNKLSLKIETIINKNKEEGVLKTWENIVSIGNYNIDFTDIPGAGNEANPTRLWRVKDQYGKIINDYFDIAVPLILTEFHIINIKTLSKFKTRQQCLKTLSKIKEDENFKNIKDGFLIIRNSIPSIIEIFNRFYDPNYFVDKAFKQKNSREIQAKLEVTKSSLENLIGKTAIVKVDDKVGIIYNFDPLICYKADLDLLTIRLREQQAGNQLASISEDYGRIYPILYPYSNVRVTNDGEATFHPNLLGFYNLWDEATSEAGGEVKRKHISFPGYYEESQNKFSGYNFKNMPVLSAGTYSRYPMVAPENPDKRTVIGNFYIINNPSEFSPREGIPRLTEIFYERHHRNRSLEIELKTTGNPSLIKELKKEDLGNKANIVLGTPVFFLSEKVKSENQEYFTNKEMFVDLDKIEAIYFFDKKDYNPGKETNKTSSKNTAYSLEARK